MIKALLGKKQGSVGSLLLKIPFCLRLQMTEKYNDNNNIQGTEVTEGYENDGFKTTKLEVLIFKKKNLSKKT